MQIEVGDHFCSERSANDYVEYEITKLTPHKVYAVEMLLHDSSPNKPLVTKREMDRPTFECWVEQWGMKV